MLKRTLITLAVIVLLLPSILLGVLLYSEAGLQVVVRELWRIPGISIQVQGASGRLAGPLRVAHFELEQKRVHLKADDVQLDVQPLALLSGFVKITALAASNVEVQVKEAPPSPPSTPHFLPGSMRIVVDNVDVRGARFTYANRLSIDADHVLGNVVLTSTRIDVSELQIESQLADLRGTVHLVATQPLGLGVDAKVISPTPRGPNVAALVKVSGDVAHMNVSSTFTSPSRAQVDGIISTGAPAWHIAGAVKSATFSLSPWLEKPPFSFAAAALNLEMSADGISVQGNLTVPEVPAGQLRIAARGKFANKTVTIQQALVQPVSAPTRVNAKGRIQFVGGAPELDVHVDWTGLQWPLKGSSVVSSARGTATLSGSMPYAFSVGGVLETSQFKVDEFASRGVLSKTDIAVEQFSAKLLQGQLDGKAKLEFAEPRAWTLQVDGSALNPGTLRQDWPGLLDVSALAHGSGVNNRAEFTMDINKLQGQLRQQPLQGRATVQRTRGGWRVEGLRGSFGRARLILDGSWERRLDARWSIQNLNLNLFSPDLEGVINTAGAASGTRDTPRFAGDIQARRLRFGDWRIAVFDADADIDMDPQHRSHVNVLAEEIGNPQARIAKIDTQGRGTVQANTFKIDVELAAPPNGSAAHAVGSFSGQLKDMQEWFGTADALTVTDSAGDAFELAQPATLKIAKDNVAADELCLTHEQARLCAHGQWHREGKWRVDAAAQDVPLALLDPNRKDEEFWQGTLRADVHAGAEADRPWTGKMSLDLIDTAIRYQSPSGTAELVAFGSGHVDALATPERATAHLHVATPENSVIDAHGNIDRSSEAPFMQAPLEVIFHAHTSEAKLLPLFLTDIDRAAGELDIDAQISGSLSAPRINGLLALKDAQLDAYRVNLALRQVNARVQLIEDRAQIDGSAKAGEGMLKANGTLTWHQGEPRGALHLEGQQLLVADLPEYRVVASPNLDFSVAGRAIDVRGVVTIPSARIQPKDLSGAVQASADARLINDQRGDGRSQFRVSSDIRIQMGDDVRLDTFGLQGILGGSVQTLLRPDETPLGRGELAVSEGKYTAYGQKLEIKRGRLLFEHTSLDDPGLDVQAERKIEQITVGVNVRGTLRAPTLQLYSDPTMSQPEIFSYLVVGKPLDTLQGQEAATVNSVRNSVALQGGGFLASQLGHRIGLEEVGVETTTNTATNTKSTSLVLGKFLSPRLFISYGISLTEAINTLKLRYTVSDHWVFKTEAGQRQGADLEYTIER